MPLVFNVPELKTASLEAPDTTTRHIVGTIRRRTRVAKAGLVITWIFICGFVLVAKLLGWRL